MSIMAQRVWGVGEKNDKSLSLSFVAFLVITNGFRKEYPHRANVVRDFLANENMPGSQPHRALLGSDRPRSLKSPTAWRHHS